MDNERRRKGLERLKVVDLVEIVIRLQDERAILIKKVKGGRGKVNQA
jgi:hypothetical protein